jgi:hypothetical protein
VRSRQAGVEPGQHPDFCEFTIALLGALFVDSDDGAWRPGSAQEAGRMGALRHAAGRRRPVHNGLRPKSLSLAQSTATNNQSSL